MVPFDLRVFRSVTGFSQNEVALHLGVSLRTAQNYETNGHIPEECSRNLKSLFEDHKEAYYWMIDQEPLVDSEAIQNMISHLTKRKPEFENAILWGERTTLPRTGEEVIHTPAERELHRLLLAKSYLGVGRAKEAYKLASECEKLSKKRMQEDNKDDYQRNVWGRVYVEARNMGLVEQAESAEQAEAGKFSLKQMVTELQRLIVVVNGIGTRKNCLYPYLKWKLHWNILNAAMLLKPEDQGLAVDAVTNLIKLHNKEKVKYWMKNDRDVVKALEISEVSVLLK